MISFFKKKISFSLRLLRPSELIKTSRVDQAFWNYIPLLGQVQKLRFKLILRLISGQRFHRLLEVGYGSGVFMAELASYCEELFGIDIHPYPQKVFQILKKRGVMARLHEGTASSMPFPDCFFDCILCISTLEYMENLESVCLEFARVLKPQGLIATVSPGHFLPYDIILRIIMGKKPEIEYQNRRREVFPILSRHFDLERKLTFPRQMDSTKYIYQALRLRKTNGHETKKGTVLFFD